jgi:hypothetical protein
VHRILWMALALGVAAPGLAAEFAPTGTLGFRFRCSRTVRVSPDPKGKTLAARIVHCPAMDITLQELRRHPRLLIQLHAAGKRGPRGLLFFSHLKRGQWYHLAVAWDAPTGRLEVYLNGVLQQYCIAGFREPTPWEPPAELSGEMQLGGQLGAGDTAATIAVDTARVWPKFLAEAEVTAAIADLKLEPLHGEGRTVYTGPLDLSPYKLTPVYEADFAKPLNVVTEDALFDGEKRVRLPEGRDWVFEGPGKAWTEGGRLHIESFKPKEGGHVVLWNTRAFPADFLLEFGISPQDSSMGLNIVFFCTASREGGGIFDLGLPRRGGVFKSYHSGALDCYHISYWAVAATGVPRRTANLRKNHGFLLPACGDDRIAGMGAGPHKVRLLKVGNRIRLETRGQLALAFDDDGKTYGPVHGPGRIGLRQMAHTHKASYTGFNVWKVEPK